MGTTGTTPARRALRPWVAVAIVAALLTAGAVILVSTSAASPPLTAGMVLLGVGITTIALRRLTTPG